MNNQNPDKPTPESLAWIEDMTEERIDAEKIKKCREPPLHWYLKSLLL